MGDEFLRDVAAGRAVPTFNAASAGYYGGVVFRHGFEGTSPFRYKLKLWSGTANPAADLPAPPRQRLPAATRACASAKASIRRASSRPVW